MSQLPPEFDEYQPSNYDPQFTADISMQMNVPDRIEVAGSNDPESLRLRPLVADFVTEQDFSDMSVPEKIVVLGRDHSAGMKQEPNLHLDLVQLPNENMFVNLQTPPRVLTLDERSFPTLEDTELRTDRGANGRIKGRFSRDGLIAERDIIVMHRQLATLTERVQQLELNNNRRWHRDLVLYPVLLGYVLLRLARWLITNK